MAKQGMKRFYPKHPKNAVPPVPRVEDDLARENQMNDWDMTAADRQDLEL